MVPKDCPKAYSATPHQDTRIVHYEAEVEAKQAAFHRREAQLRKLVREAQKPQPKE